MNYDKCKHVESCASIRGYSGEVARFKEVIVTGHDKAGKKVIHNLKGLYLLLSKKYLRAHAIMIMMNFLGV